MMLRIRGARQGMSLIEVTVVMALLLVLLSLTSTAIWSTIRIERAEAAAFQKTIQHSILADQFREDVANSKATPQEFGDHSAGADRIILAQADGKHIVYSWLGKQVERTEITEDAATTWSMPIGEDLKVEFARSDSQGELIVIRFFDLRKGMSLQTPVEFAAGLGGNLK